MRVLKVITCTLCTSNYSFSSFVLFAEPAPTDTKMFACNESGCSYESKNRANLRRHGLTHNPKAANGNRCRLCNFKTVHADNLVRHMRLKHGVLEKRNEARRKGRLTDQFFCSSLSLQLFL